MLHSAYLAAWSQPRFEVLGRELVPFTLGHARALYVAGSPVVVPDSGPVAFDDVALAVAVCALRVAPASERDMLAVVESAKMIRTGNQSEAIQVFGAYIKAYLEAMPRFDEQEPRARIPWPWAFVSVLMRHYSMTSAQAWATLCADGFWLSACVAIQQGYTGYPTLKEAATISMMEAE